MRDADNEKLAASPVRGKISKAYLQSVLTQRQANHLFAEFDKSNRKSLIPDFEKLRAGDLILTRMKESTRSRFSLLRRRKKKLSKIVQVQLDAGIPIEHAIWTHVSVYVGNCLIVEAVGFKDVVRNKLRDWRRWEVGVQCKSLLKYTERHEILVRRHVDPAFDQTGISIALHATCDLALGRRKYAYFRAASLAVPEKLRKWLGPSVFNRSTRVMCSDLALECYQWGGKLLPDLPSLKSNGVLVILPAEFATDERFFTVKLDYFDLEK